MDGIGNVGPRIILGINDGQFLVTETLLFGISVAVIIAVVLLWLAKDLRTQPTKKQVIAEFIVEFIYNMTKKTMGVHNVKFFPYIGTIFIFILFGSAIGIMGFRPVTADVNMAFALSIMTFFVINYFSIRSMGFKGKLKHMCEPYAFMFPLKIIEIISQPISLGFRLFGNILGGVIVMSLIYGGLASACYALAKTIPIFQIPLLEAVFPLPFMLFFDVFHPVIQAYIFTMLTMVFVSMEIIIHGDGEQHK